MAKTDHSLGAPEAEIEITPEMIRAGVNFAEAQLDGLDSISTPGAEALVRGVIEAVFLEGRRACSLGAVPAYSVKIAR